MFARRISAGGTGATPKLIGDDKRRLMTVHDRTRLIDGVTVADQGSSFLRRAILVGDFFAFRACFRCIYRNQRRYFFDIGLNYMEKSDFFPKSPNKSGCCDGKTSSSQGDILAHSPRDMREKGKRQTNKCIKCKKKHIFCGFMQKY